MACCFDPDLFSVRLIKEVSSGALCSYFPADINQRLT